MSENVNNFTNIHLNNLSGVAPVVVNGMRTWYLPGPPAMGPMLYDVQLGDLYYDTTQPDAPWRYDGVTWVQVGGGVADGNTYLVPATAYDPVHRAWAFQQTDANANFSVGSLVRMYNYWEVPGDAWAGGPGYKLTLSVPIHPGLPDELLHSVSVTRNGLRLTGVAIGITPAEYQILSPTEIRFTIPINSNDVLGVYYEGLTQ